MIDKVINDAIDFSFTLISFITDAECLGIRLKSDSKHHRFPFYKTMGYRKSFLSQVDCLNNDPGSDKLVCLCGQVIRSPAKVIQNRFSKEGSYWRNKIDPLFFKKFSKQLALKKRCISEGFESLALIPLHNRKNCQGLFHIADYLEDKFDRVKIGRLEKVGMNLAQLILGIEELTVNFKQSKIKILIAEDEFELNNLLYKMLEKLNYKCCSVYNGLEAFDLIKKKKIDILLTDIDMPGMNGVELIKKVREKYDIYGPKIVVLSGYIDEISDQMIKECRISNVISKPVDLGTLKKIIDNVYEEAI